MDVLPKNFVFDLGKARNIAEVAPSTALELIRGVESELQKLEGKISEEEKMETYGDIGIVYLKLKRYGSAEEFLTKVCNFFEKNAPNSPDTAFDWYYLSIALDNNGKPLQAYSAIQKGYKNLRFSPDFNEDRNIFEKMKRYLESRL